MKRFFAIIVLAVVVILGGCTQIPEDSIQPSVYRMEDARYPLISLEEDGTFVIEYNVMATRESYGTYTVANRVLTLSADDGAKYCFKIKNKKIVFLEDMSTPFEVVEGDPAIENKTEFDLWRVFE